MRDWQGQTTSPMRRSFSTVRCQMTRLRLGIMRTMCPMRSWFASGRRLQQDLPDEAVYRKAYDDFCRRNPAVYPRAALVLAESPIFGDAPGHAGPREARTNCDA